jgi:dATP pyrophosphohydrolase
MPRAPFNVMVYPYIEVGSNEFEYALLKRSDNGAWLGVAGGGEDKETLLEAARRETYEEAGISADSAFIKLDTIWPLPITLFSPSHPWDKSIYIIPQYTFGVRVEDKRIVPSAEHTEYGWFKYHDAYNLIIYDGARTALWELDRKVRGLGPRD